MEKYEKYEMSEQEKKIRQITQLYYSRADVQKVIFDFSKNREISPRYFEGFGKRPDSFGFKGDVFSLVKKGATSFHCSEEIWEDPFQLSTDLKPVVGALAVAADAFASSVIIISFERVSAGHSSALHGQ